MQTFYPDAYNRFKSLDDIYYYGGQNAHNVISVLPHSPASHNQIQVKTGDLIGIAGNHWDGYSKGKNLRTNVSTPLVTVPPGDYLIGSVSNSSKMDCFHRLKSTTKWKWLISPRTVT